MSNITSSATYISNNLVLARNTVSEFVLQTIGGTINYLLDHIGKLSGVSGSCGSFSTTSTSYVAITNLTVTFTASGNPVLIGVIPEQNYSGGSDNYNGASANPFISWYKDGSILSEVVSNGFASNTGNGHFLYIDVPSAGSHTYTLRMKTASGTVVFNGYKIFYVEL